MLEIAKDILKDISLEDAVKNQIRDFESFSRDQLYCLGVGKAAVRMVEIVRSQLKIPASKCLALTKNETGEVAFEVLYGNHPVPGEETRRGTEKLLLKLKEIPVEATLIFCLSGGTSSLMELPKNDISWDDLKQAFSEYLNGDFTIRELNERRSQLSQLKQGGLLKFIPTQKVVSLVLSDVPFDDLTIVGSGPTRGSELRCVLDWQALWRAGSQKFGVAQPKEIRAERGELRDNLPRILDRVTKTGYFLGVGELHNHVTGSGRGGRCSHFIGTLANELFIKNSYELSADQLARLTVFALASDGQDGPSEFAGGWLQMEDLIEYPELKEDLEVALENFDTLSLLAKYNRVFSLGPTGQNLMDLYFIGQVQS